MVQRYGTDKVGYTFAPIIFVWFTFIAGIGVYNFIKFDPTVIKAINPVYIVDYFRRNKKDAWVSLGGVFLAITGFKTTEKIGNAYDTNLCRIPGLAMFYSELVHGIPPIFEHYVANVPALHSVLVFVSIKSLPISKVAAEERFLFRKVEPKELNVFRCVVRYGYTDIRNEQDSFEWTLVERLKEFIKDNILLSHVLVSNGKTTKRVDPEGEEEENERQVEEDWREGVDREISLVDKAWEAGVVHLIGENKVISSKGAGIGKRVIIDYAYNFLKKNLRQSEKVFDIPHKRMLKVGMTYEL
ncbi:potassium transporter [Corchorus olitorius]|uniref:Potassium transporter n=1 Tax=Corchorus olitorius TaxID=93759 RepID=A0A1R3KHT7_9ROSI|nr:potassium transporter [Corchorus olitorius]